MKNELDQNSIIRIAINICLDSYGIFYKSILKDNLCDECSLEFIENLSDDG